MNYEQIKNGEERIFPFYRGKYMGTMEFGYSNKKSAQKFMKDIPDRDVYAKFGGEDEYCSTHEYLCNLSERTDYFGYFHFNEVAGEGIHRDRSFDDIHSEGDERVYLKDLPFDEVQEMKKVLNKIGFISTANEDPEKLEAVREFIRRWNLFPRIWTDIDDFSKMHWKMMKEEVVYRRGIVHVNIEYLD